MNRRCWLTAACITLAATGATFAQEPSLQDTLKNGLRARRPIEFQFVNEITQLTNEGKLPKDFVLAAFDYSRTRRPKFPLPYFEFVVRDKARQLGVTITTPSLLTN